MQTRSSSISIMTTEDLNEYLKRFREMEAVTPESCFSPEQEAREADYAQSTRRNSSNGRYIVRFSFKADVNPAERLASSVQFAIMKWQ